MKMKFHLTIIKTGEIVSSYASFNEALEAQFKTGKVDEYDIQNAETKESLSQLSNQYAENAQRIDELADHPERLGE